MKNIFLVLAVSAAVVSAQPANCQKVTVENRIEILHSKPGWDRTPNPYITTDIHTESVKKAGQSKLALPGTPMGAAIRMPGDYLYQKPARGTQAKQGHGLSGLPDTQIGPAVGMAGDHVGRQNSAEAASYNSIGLPSANLGATVGRPGDSIRSDLPGYKRFQSRRSVAQQATVNDQTSNQATDADAATYGSYDGTKKRNY